METDGIQEAMFKEDTVGWH